MKRPDSCPKCGAGFDASDIFTVLRSQSWCEHMSDEELRQYVIDCYGGPYARFSRVIWVTSVADSRVGYWMCPDCKAFFA